MRPRKEVLLLMRNEDELGAWRMRLEVWGYRVSTSLDPAEAIRYPGLHLVDAVATSIPGRAGADALVRHHQRVLLFDVPASCPPGHAHRIESRGPVLPERVREALKTMCARKRGPAPKKPVQSAAVESAENAA